MNFEFHICKYIVCASLLRMFWYLNIHIYYDMKSFVLAEHIVLNILGISLTISIYFVCQANITHSVVNIEGSLSSHV